MSRLVSVYFFIFVSIHPQTIADFRSFGDQCSFGGFIGKYFNSDIQDRFCDREQGLICVGTCQCPPGRVWDTNVNFFGDVSGRKRCANAVGTPCFFGHGSGDERCVSNAQCENAICRCKPKFIPNGGHCIGSVGSTQPVTVSNNNNENNSGQQNSGRPPYPILFGEGNNNGGSSSNNGGDKDKNNEVAIKNDRHFSGTSNDRHFNSGAVRFVD